MSKRNIPCAEYDRLLTKTKKKTEDGTARLLIPGGKCDSEADLKAVIKW